MPATDKHLDLLIAPDERRLPRAQRLEAPKHSYDKWAGTFAGVFLTLGLLFTFVGLSAALFKVGDAGADAVHLREAINGILSVSSAKFITSIAGIIFFILWTIIARWFVSSQLNVIDRFASRVQSLSTMLSPEVILIDQLMAAREQTDRMKTLPTMLRWLSKLN